jgi:hypothetical protein
LLGTLVENTVVENAGPPLPASRTFPGEAGGLSIGAFLETLETDSILITGKPDAPEGEQAVLRPEEEGSPTLRIGASRIRLEHIVLSGLSVPEGGSPEAAALVLNRGVLILGKGAQITGNQAENHAGVYALQGVVILREDAEIAYNQATRYGGMLLAQGSLGIMLDHARIVHNQATGGNGGGLGITGSRLIMRGRSAIRDNFTDSAGGGVITLPDPETGALSEIILQQEAVIRGNTATLGGGILLQDRLTLQDSAGVMDNMAIEAGGGVWGLGSAWIRLMGDACIAHNRAPAISDLNITVQP